MTHHLVSSWPTKFSAYETKQANLYNVWGIFLRQLANTKYSSSNHLTEFHKWKVPYASRVPFLSSLPFSKSFSSDHLTNWFPASPAHYHMSFQCLNAWASLLELPISINWCGSLVCRFLKGLQMFPTGSQCWEPRIHLCLNTAFSTSFTRNLWRMIRV